MTDPKIRPIIFSAPMVRALLAGRKTQTRRITPCPLMKTEVGDLLYVREAFSGPWGCRNLKPKDWPDGAPIHYWADGNPEDGEWTLPKPSIHLPMKFSRLTLGVKRVFFDRIQQISSADAIAEGIARNPHGNGDQWMDYPAGSSAAGWQDPRDSFRSLWDSLHTKPGETWADNPMEVALEFEVIHGNVDKIAGGDDEQAA